ncbi:uncharacterized protein L201_001793 [Kwoniella dendrophila CBS 6074]|uniref:F-box domain-containing protein n=1 Tax=Kwoniella dendrophila CBS 6074 TaxID=1295534 RepID=A0AAX4JPV0_9TREE
MPPRKASSSQSNSLPLPVDILSLVFSILQATDRHSLTTCCRVSHSFFDIAGPILYRHISVSPNNLLDSRKGFSPDKFTSNGKEKSNTRKKKLLKTAEVVIMDDHHASWCGNKSFKYPKLDTLVLFLCVNGLGPVLHSNDILEKQCSLVKCLNPRKLVLQNCTLNNIQGEMLGIPYKIFQTVEQITYITGLSQVKPNSSWGGLPKENKLKKIVWIFDPSLPTMRWKPGEIGIFGRENRDSTLDFMALMPLSGFLRNLNDLNPIPPVYIVNSGWLDHKYQLKEGIIQQGYRRGMHLNQNTKQWEQDTDPEDIQKEQADEQKSLQIFNSITFLTMKEYLNNHDWKGEINSAIAKLWLA